MSKQYSNGSALNEKILKGMNVLADNVGTTLGPKGRNVILYDKTQNIPVITKDGVTIQPLMTIGQSYLSFLPREKQYCLPLELVVTFFFHH